MPGHCPTGLRRRPRRRRRRCSGRRLTGSAAATAEATTAAAAAAGLVDLGGGVLQARADLVDLELDHGALLALTGLERTLLEPSADDYARAASQALGHVLGGLPPDVAAKEQRFAVLPLVGLTVEHARRRRDREVRDGRARRRETQFGVGGQVSDNRDDSVTSHSDLLSPLWISSESAMYMSHAEPTQRLGRAAVVRQQAPGDDADRLRPERRSLACLVSACRCA